ncbi:MAG: hypothetical protein Q9173_006001 [Seirophora scorigena]
MVSVKLLRANSPPTTLTSSSTAGTPRSSTLSAQASKKPREIQDSHNSYPAAIAREIASHDFNIVFHGRNPSKLDAGHASLEEAFPKYVRGDDGRRDGEADQFELGLAHPTHPCIAPHLLGDSRRLKLLINIGSIGASGGLPYAAVYGACKAFNHVCSKGLDAEMQHANPQRIDVLGVLVGGVTQMTQKKTPSSIATPDVTTMTRAAVQKIGCGRAEVVGYWSHAAQYDLSSWLPEWMLGRLKVRIIKGLQIDEGKSK